MDPADTDNMDKIHLAKNDCTMNSLSWDYSWYF